MRPTSPARPPRTLHCSSPPRRAAAVAAALVAALAATLAAPLSALPAARLCALLLASFVALAASMPAASASGGGLALTAALINARAQQVFGALQRDDEGHQLRERRRLRLPGTSRERADLPAGTRLRLGAVHRVRDRGVPHDVMLWHGDRPDNAEGGGFQQQVSVLAVFRAGEATPTDVAEVQTDRMTYFAEPAVQPLGTQDDLFDLVNHPANAGQPYAEHSLYHLSGGRLRRIVQVDLLADFSGCAKSFEQTIAWRTEPDAAQPLPRIVAEVTVHHAPKAHTTDCRPRPPAHQQLYSARYRWDATADRYRAEPGGTLDKLARWNEARR